jgi:hypothetical protein
MPLVGRVQGARWLALHAAPPDWTALFTRALDLMLIEVVNRDGTIVVGERLGRVTWRGASGWTLIDVDLAGMSEKKQAVVKAALLKAARYAR